MDWGRRLLMKMEATAHKPKKLMEAVKFEVGLLVDGDLTPDDQLAVTLSIRVVLWAFEQYLLDGLIYDWHDTMDAIKDDLRAIGRV